MLGHMHAGTARGYLCINEVPVTEAQLARMVGESLPRIRKLLNELQANGVFARAENGAIYSRRMVRDEELRAKRGAFGVLSLNNPSVPRPKDTQMDTIKDTIGPSIGGSPSVAVAVAVASSTALQLPTTTTASRRKKRDAAATGGEGSKSTWLTPIGAAWEAENGKGSFPYPQAAKELKPLADAGHTTEVIARRLAWYLKVRGLDTPDPDPAVIARTRFTPNLRDFRLRFARFDPERAA